MFGVLCSKFLNMKPYSILLIAALSGGIISCKKNNVEHFDAAGKEPVEKLSAWFDNQRKAIPPSTVAILGADQPDWGQAKYFDEQGLYITPVVLKEKKQAVKFFVARQDEKAFKDGSYFVFLTAKGTVMSNPEQLIVNRFNTGKTDNDGFSGAMLQYDLDDKLISAAHYKNGNKTSTADKLVYKPKQERKENDNEGPVGSVAPLECGEGASQFCIDWFWQTYEEGVLVEEEYLYTTCYCGTSGGGGGSGGGNNGCNMTVSSAQSILNGITGSAENSGGFLTLGEPLQPKLGKVRVPLHGYGGGYKLFIIFNSYIFWRSEYSGWAYKYDNIPNDPWKFESIKWEGFPMMEGSTTMCITTSVTTTHSEYIYPDKLRASTYGTCHITVNIACLGGLITAVKTGTFGRDFLTDDMRTNI